MTRDLIAEKSPQGFLISDAAKAAGVSPAAPYRHFKGKEDLIAAVAEEGFLRFGEALSQAYHSKTNPFDGLLALGEAYLEFASTHKGEYMAMFESSLNLAGSTDLTHAATQAFAPLQEAATALLEEITPPSRPPVNMVAQHILAMSHGIAELFGRGAGNFSAYEPSELLESNLRIYLSGLGA